MLITPRVFVSAVSSDLQSARQMVCRALNELECLPVEQCHLGTQYGPVRDMLRKQIASCQAVIHIVGRDYGGEPVPPGNPRRSWTQLEYDLALELHRKLYVIVCSQKYSFDPVPQPEPAAKAALQAQHCHQVLGGQYLWHQVNAPSDLRDCVLRLKLPLDEVRTALRRQQSRQRLLIGAGAAAVVLALGRLGTTVEDAAVRVKQSVEHTGANVQQVIEETQRQSGAKLDRQSEQLLLVELGLQALDEATRELTARLDGQSSLSEVGFLSARVDDLLSDVDETLASQSIPVSGVRVIRDAKAASLRATMRLEHYPINPPDVLFIEGVHLIPRGPQVVRSGQQLFVDSTDPRLRDVVLTVGAGGELTLPDQIGSVSIGGLSISEAEKAVAKLLPDAVVDPIVIIELADPHQFQQPISGEHLVAPDGRVTLGIYG